MENILGVHLFLRANLSSFLVLGTLWDLGLSQVRCDKPLCDIAECGYWHLSHAGSRARGVRRTPGRRVVSPQGQLATPGDICALQMRGECCWRLRCRGSLHQPTVRSTSLATLSALSAQLHWALPLFPPRIAISVCAGPACAHMHVHLLMEPYN